MSSSLATTVARHRQPHFKRSSAWEAAGNQRNTSRFVGAETSTARYSGLLKQPDNEKSACIDPPAHRHLLQSEALARGVGHSEVYGDTCRHPGGILFSCAHQFHETPPCRDR